MTWTPAGCPESPGGYIRFFSALIYHLPLNKHMHMHMHTHTHTHTHTPKEGKTTRGIIIIHDFLLILSK